MNNDRENVELFYMPYRYLDTALLLMLIAAFLLVASVVRSYFIVNKQTTSHLIGDVAPFLVLGLSWFLVFIYRTSRLEISSERIVRKGVLSTSEMLCSSIQDAKWSDQSLVIKSDARIFVIHFNMYSNESRTRLLALLKDVIPGSVQKTEKGSELF